MALRSLDWYGLLSVDSALRITIFPRLVDDGSSDAPISVVFDSIDVDYFFRVACWIVL